MIFDESWCGVRVQVLDNGTISDVDLLTFDFRWHRYDDCEVIDIALEIIGHCNNSAIFIAHQHDL